MAVWAPFLLHRFENVILMHRSWIDIVSKVSASEIPVLICRGEVGLRNPSNQQIANCLGFNESVDQTQDARSGRHRCKVHLGQSLPEYMVLQKDLTFCRLKQTSPVGQAGYRGELKNDLGISHRYLRPGSWEVVLISRRRSRG